MIQRNMYHKSKDENDPRRSPKKGEKAQVGWELVPFYRCTGPTTCSTISCMNCGCVVASMGGPRNNIMCESCYSDLKD